MPDPPMASDPPPVKLAKVHHATWVTLSCVAAVVTLSILQKWPVDTSLMALGALSGLWVIGRVMNGGKK